MYFTVTFDQFNAFLLKKTIFLKKKKKVYIYIYIYRTEVYVHKTNKNITILNVVKPLVNIPLFVTFVFLFLPQYSTEPVWFAIFSEFKSLFA